MDRWKCKKCGYVYDPQYGDKKAGINSGTAFEDLPADWRCPRCNAPKNAFIKL